MTPREALHVLDQATDPTRVGKLARQDYVLINSALIVLSDVVSKSVPITSADVPQPACEPKPAP